MNPETLRRLFWIASARKDIQQMPEEVQDAFGYALYLAQTGGRHEQVKSLKGFGPGVLEVVEDSRGSTFRAVYTVRFETAVYVLHCFQKKSTQGIATPKMHLEVIKERLKVAETHAKRGRGD
jgi:phage-related protein